MAHVGFAPMLMLALMSGGYYTADVVTLIQPKHYFQNRQIEISVDRAIDYASDDPKTPKTQIVQLTALRYLSDESEALKKSPKVAGHRKVLEEIAAGKKAADPQGFAQDYANRVLLKLDSAKQPAAKITPLRDSALSWFPAEATLAMAVDLQFARDPGFGANDPLKGLLKLMPEREKKEMYDYLERSGNIRLERIAFATDYREKREERKMYLRFTGKANHDWVHDMIKSMARNEQFDTKQWKDNGTQITQLKGKFSPAIVLVGNTDIIVTGFDNPRAQDVDLVDEVMAARAGKKPNAATGALKARVAKVPEKAVAFLVGNVPDELKREFGFILNPVPSNVTAYVERVQQGLDVQVETALTNAEDADKLVQKVGALRKQGIDELKKAMQMPLPPGFPMVPFQSMINVLDTLQVQSTKEQVNVRVFVPDTLIRQVGEMSTGFFGPGLDLEPPPPPKEEKK